MKKLLDLVHEGWRQGIEIAYFGVETRTNRSGNHAVVPDSLSLLGLLGINHPDEPRLNQTEQKQLLIRKTSMSSASPSAPCVLGTNPKSKGNTAPAVRI